MCNKLARLRRVLSGCESAVVAFSGGVDSTLLLKVAADILGPRVVAATVNSPLAVPGELDRARELAGLIGVRHFVIKGKALADPGFRRNPPERCYICKRYVYTAMWELARETGTGAVLDGANADDQGDFRPGLRAAREMGVGSPLLEAGLTKDEIRSLSREMGLPNWNLPAQPCLATRIPYGDPVDETKLLQIAKAEKFLYDRGFTAVRVRHHGPVARLELLPGEMGLLGDPGLREEIDTELKKLGFSFVGLDLAGLRSGSLNDLLEFAPGSPSEDVDKWISTN